ncbi:hypothetical protein [Ruegeria atlantica]|uniref:hypothetical protein n=1 Tax=Ruegeria atlantica TaxID=81569 RepID=UPI00147E18ED|nr:hypothetical protein [Ruegeria atlantica]
MNRFRTKGWMMAGAALLIAATSAMSQETAETRSGNGGLREMAAIRDGLQADVRALQRVAAYQEGLLRLAGEDPEDALRARRSERDCLAELNAASLCAALTGSFERVE